MSNNEKESSDESSGTDDKKEIRIATLTIELPAFWGDLPELWFQQFERYVKNKKKGVNDDAMYDKAISKLPTEVIKLVADIISDPPECDKYKTLKGEIIRRKSLSETQRLDKLLAPHQMGDQSPSAFYRTLETLGRKSNIIGQDLIKQMWMKRLPSTVSGVLVINQDAPLPKLLETADKIWELNGPVVATLSKENHKQFQSTSRGFETSNSDGDNETIINAIEELKKSIAVIQKDMNRSDHNNYNRNQQYRRNFNRDFKPRSNSRPRSNSSNRDRNDFYLTKENLFYCWAHYKFGKDARGCKGGRCEFKRIGSSGSSSSNGNKNEGNE